jgi:hypothetical protein
MLRILLALLFVLALPLEVWAETCTALLTLCDTENPTWNDAAPDPGGLWSTGPTTCTPTADDTYVIPSGCTITTTGALDIRDETATPDIGGVTVQAGGTWIVTNADVAFGSTGITQDTGGTITITPRFRDNDSTTVLSAVPTTPQGFWRAGIVLPCGGWDDSDVRWEADCGGALVDAGDLAGGDNVIALLYDTNQWPSTLGTAIGAIAATDGSALPDRTTGEFIQFVRASASGYEDQSYENAHWFEIVDAGTMDETGTENDWYYIRIDVRQSKIDFQKATDYPLARRDIVTDVTGAAIAKGARTFTSTATTLITATVLRHASWAYFEGGSTTPTGNSALGIRQQPVPLARNIDGGGGADTFTFEAIDGAPFAVGAGDDYYISNVAIRPDDPFIVIDPTIFHSTVTTATAEEVNVGRFTTNGTVRLQGALFHNIASLRLASLTPSTTCDIDNIAVWEGCADSGCANMSVAASTDGASCSVDHVSITGTRDDGGSGQRGHGIVQGAVGLALTSTLSDISIRYHQDDCVNENANATEVSGTVARLYCSYVADTAESDGLWEPSSTSGASVLRGGVCRDCALDNSASRGVIDCNRARCEASDLHFVAPRKIIANVNVNTQSVFLTNATIVAPIAQGDADFLNMSNFVVRDFDQAAAATLFFWATPTVPTTWRNGLIYRNDISGAGTIESIMSWSGTATQTGVFDNLAFIDNLGDTADYMLRNTIDAEQTWPVTLKRWTVGMTDQFRKALGADPWTVGLILNTAGTATYSAAILDGLLFDHFFNDAGAIFIQATAGRDNPDWLNGPCMFGNLDQSDGTSATLTGTAPLTSTQATELSTAISLGLVDPEKGDFSPRRGGVAQTIGCGATASAGVTSKGWSHFMSGQEPESMGSLGGSVSGGGGGGSRTGPRAF